MAETAAASASAQALSSPSPVTRQAVAMDYAEPVVESAPAPEPLRTAEPAPVPERRRAEHTAKLIEFPRTYSPPAWSGDLAEPMVDRPRILEAPELLPPPPALGGMTIEEAAKPEPERRPGIDMPLQSAAAERRMLAAAIDGIVVLCGSALFAAIYYRITGVTPAWPQAAMLGGGLLGLCWAAYQFLLVVYSGTTPGLRALKLNVRRFDGQPANRKLRRTRVLCALLSAVSLGMGYAWHFLDEDGLCWHERVTKTHIAPQKQS